MSICDKICKWFIFAIIFIAIGYAWAFYVFKNYESQAEKDLYSLEAEFHRRLEMPPTTFKIFNGQFEIYPVKETNRFHYTSNKEAEQ